MYLNFDIGCDINWKSTFGLTYSFFLKVMIIIVSVTKGFMVVACWVYILVVLWKSTNCSEAFLGTRGVKVIEELDSMKHMRFLFVCYLPPLCFIHIEAKYFTSATYLLQMRDTFA